MSKGKRLAWNSTLPAPEKGMRKINPKRIRKLREKQFGDDGEAKKKWIVSMLCGVTGTPGTELFPIDPAHVGSPDPDERGQSTRAAGADSRYLFPLRRDVHDNFDNLPEGKFEELWGVSVQWIREYAEDLDRQWLRMRQAEMDEAERAEA